IATALTYTSTLSLHDALPIWLRSRGGRSLMPHIERTAHVGWDGNLARGAGTLDGESGALARLPFSLASRVGDPGGKTSPEELLADRKSTRLNSSHSQSSYAVF